MKPFSFIHTADLHLDSPFTGISEINDELGSRLAAATFESYKRIVDQCIEREIDFLLIVGDVYDGADRSLRAQLKFRDGLGKLSEAGIPAYIAHGNHDPLDGWSANLDWPEAVHIFGGKSVESLQVTKDNDPVAVIHGISFNKRNIQANLTSKFPQKAIGSDSLFSIGMLHCNVGTNTGHESYAPCTKQDLFNCNVDYWALGHVHTRMIVSEEGCVIVYPGNPQGRHPRETGSRGCYLVTVDENGTATPTFIEVDSIRWEIKEISVTDLYTEQELLAAVHDSVEEVREEAAGRPSVCRIILTGSGPLHRSIARKGILQDILEEIRETEEGEKDFVWVERLVNNTSPAIDVETLTRRNEFAGMMIQRFNDIRCEEVRLQQLSEVLEPLLSSPGGRKTLEKLNEESLSDLLNRAETLCLDRLLRAGSDEV